jgi:hypothetical protein
VYMYEWHSGAVAHIQLLQGGGQTGGQHAKDMLSYSKHSKHAKHSTANNTSVQHQAYLQCWYMRQHQPQLTIYVQARHFRSTDTDTMTPGS